MPISWRRLFGHNGWAVAATVFPLAADAAHFWWFDALNGALRRLLATPGFAAIVTLAGLYAAWLVTLSLVGRLRVEDPGTQVPMGEVELRTADGGRRRVRFPWPKLLFFYPSLLFGLVWVMLIVQATGSSSAPAVPSAAQDWTLGVAVLLFVAHVIVAAVDVTPRHAAGTPAHLGLLVPVVLIGELALNLASAAWWVLLADEGATGPAVRTPGELFGATLLFLVCFAGPRFTFLSRHFTWPALLSGLAFVVWDASTLP